MLALLLIAVFLGLAAAMYAGRMPAMTALPALALALTLVAGVPYYYAAAPADGGLAARAWAAGAGAVNLALGVVVKDGVVRLHVAILTVMLGGLFGQALKRAGVADAVVRRVAELAGDNAFVVTLVLSLAVALLFTTLGGLGAVMMVATVVFPVQLSLGVPPLLAGALFLLAMCLGGVFNLVNWQLFIDVLGLHPAQICRYAVPFGVLFLLVVVAFALIEFPRHKVPVSRGATLCAGAGGLLLAACLACLPSGALGGAGLFPWLQKPFLAVLALLFVLPARGTPERPSLLALLAPLVPIGLVMVLGLDIIPAFVVGIAYVLKTGADHGGPGRLLVQSAVEGIQAVAPAVAIMMGIGMVVVAVAQPPVAEALRPAVLAVLPAGPTGYVLFFTLLAPLALYRGPLNLWGMGAGLIKLFQAAGVVGDLRILAAFMATGQIQGVCDPTNTHNVWIANHLNVEPADLLRLTLPYVWALAFLGLLLGLYVG